MSGARNIGRVRTAALASAALIMGGLAVALMVEPARAATPTRLTLTAPSAVKAREDISIHARLTTDGGRPVPGVIVTLYQVGAVGRHSMGRATTDAKGLASFLHQESTVAYLSLQVVFTGDSRWGSSQAKAEVEITGIEIPPAVVMAHTASPLVKGVVFLVLGSVWATYLFAGSSIVRILRAGRDEKGSGTVRPRL